MENFIGLGVYLASFINLLIASWLYRKSDRLNKEMKQQLQRRKELNDEIQANEIQIEILTGQELIKRLQHEYEKTIMHPANIVRGMSYDDFINWLELGTDEDIANAREVFEKEGMEQYVNIIDGYLKNKQQKDG